MRRFIPYFFLLQVAILLLIWIFSLSTNQIKSREQLNECSNYRRECLQLFKKLRYPNQSLIRRPPPKMPPADLMKRFTQDGDMPIT